MRVFRDQTLKDEMYSLISGNMEYSSEQIDVLSNVLFSVLLRRALGTLNQEMDGPVVDVRAKLRTYLESITFE